MVERKYTITEIDRMRSAVEHIYLWGFRRSERVIRSGGKMSMSRTFYETDKVKTVEEQLRTYMLANIEPKELE